MRIENNIQIIDLALYIDNSILVLSDFHIGYEESLNKQGLLIPRFQFKDIIQRLENILKNIKPKTIIINGDLKHEFGKISEQEWRDALKLIDFLEKHCNKLILIKGNHDKSLQPIAKKRNITIKDEYRYKDILITHGNTIPKQLEKTIIIGHEHPAITLTEQARMETFKCFLKGKYKSSVLIIQPSFNLVTEGTNIINESVLSPFLKQDIRNFECWIANEKQPLYFGKLKLQTI